MDVSTGKREKRRCEFRKFLHKWLGAREKQNFARPNGAPRWWSPLLRRSLFFAALAPQLRQNCNRSRGLKKTGLAGRTVTAKTFLTLHLGGNPTRAARVITPRRAQFNLPQLCQSGRRRSGRRRS